jgi:hypothetical protein
MDNPLYDTPTLEKVGGNAGWSLHSHQLSAMRACAKNIGVELPVVLRALETGQLAGLIEARKGRRAERRGDARIAHLYRQKQLGLLLERDALLRSRC